MYQPPGTGQARSRASKQSLKAGLTQAQRQLAEIVVTLDEDVEGAKPGVIAARPYPTARSAVGLWAAPNLPCE
jgi:hypothetical protein